jgi:hypothetical protein
MWISSFPSTTCYRGYFSSTCFGLLCQKTDGYSCVFVYLGILLFSIDFMSFLCQYGCLIAMAQQYNLQSNTVIPPVLLFLLTLALAIQGLCASTWILGLIFLSLWKMSLKFWWIAWIYTLLLVVYHFHNNDSTNTWASEMFLSYDLFCDFFLHIFSIFLVKIFLFTFSNLFLGIFEAIVNGIVFLTSFSVCLLLVYRKAIDFYILILYPSPLHKMFMMSQSFLVEFLGFFFYV